MSKPPSYPDDAPVGPAGPEAAAASEGKAGGPQRTRHLMTGAAIGIGSAAIVAALLYANSKRGDKSS